MSIWRELLEILTLEVIKLSFIGLALRLCQDSDAFRCSKVEAPTDVQQQAEERIAEK